MEGTRAGILVGLLKWNPGCLGVIAESGCLLSPRGLLDGIRKRTLAVGGRYLGQTRRCALWNSHEGKKAGATVLA